MEYLFKSKVVGYFAHIRNKFLGVIGFHQKSKIYDFLSILDLCLVFFHPFLAHLRQFELKNSEISKKKWKFQSWHFSIIFGYKLLQWVQGFQALILAIFKGFLAFTIKNLEIQGDLERRFSVKISRCWNMAEKWAEPRLIVQFFAPSI